MNKKFVLLVEYGTGRAAMITHTPELINAIMEFKHRYLKKFPETKEYGMPEIVGAELIPIMYDSVYEEKENVKKNG